MSTEQTPLPRSTNIPHTYVHLDPPLNLAPGARPPALEPIVPIKEKVAVIVYHGMGQQVPFETIDGVARTLRIVEQQHGFAGVGSTDINTRIVKLNDDLDRVPRAELKMSGPNEKVEIDVHIYEAYWAPLTEGKVTRLDTFRFLTKAGVTGLLNCWHPFLRWMFGGWKSFKNAREVAFGFGLAILVAWSLAVMNVTIIVVAATRAVRNVHPNWPSDTLLANLTIDLIPFSVFLFLAGFITPLVLKRYGKGPHCSIPPGWRFVLWLLIYAALAAAIAAGALFLIHLTTGCMQYAKPDTCGTSIPGITWWQVLPRLHIYLFAPGWHPGVGVWLFWAMMFLLNHYASLLFVEYPGDVAAYIQPQTLSKFYEIRKAIQKIALDITAAVYEAPDPVSGPASQLYMRVVIVGHSLGSVLAYDTLNAMILRDQLSGNRLKVVERTPMLLTFGSPLDKTAFIFRKQKPREAQVREALAAAVQPMIMDYANRPANWVNLWSQEDWISGHLDYYDDPGQQNNPTQKQYLGKRIKNCEDSYANIPLLAHVMYWQSPLLREKLYEAITGRKPRVPKQHQLRIRR